MGALHLMQDEVDFGAKEPARRGQLGGSTVTAFTSGLDADGYEVCTVSLKSTSPNLTSFSANLRCPVSP